MCETALSHTPNGHVVVVVCLFVFVCFCFFVVFFLFFDRSHLF